MSENFGNEVYFSRESALHHASNEDLLYNKSRFTQRNHQEVSNLNHVRRILSQKFAANHVNELDS